MAIQKNSINKLIAEIVVPSVEEAASAQANISSFLKSQVLPLIESVADRLTVSGETIRIDRLELDFENFVPGGNNMAALEAFELKLEEELRQLISPLSHFGEAEQAVRISGKEAEEELFIFLLKEGHLPWWAKTSEPIVLQELATRVLEDVSPSFRLALRKIVREPSVRQRMAHQLPVVLIEQLLYSISNEPGLLFSLLATLKSLSSKIKDSIKGSQSYSRPEFFWRLMVELVLKNLDAPPAPGAFVLELLRSQQRVPAAQEVLLVLERMAKELEIADTSHLSVKQNKDLILQEKAGKLPGEKQEAEENAKRANVELNPLKLMEEVAARENEYFVKNAGLIILAPYIPSFFKSLGLVQDNQFVNPGAQQRGVYLLQYLSTGSETTFEEHDMLLNKTLCGINLLTPLTLQFELQEQEKEECRALLHAVVEHWTALKSTSAESMRDSFFMREGILESHTNGWNLKIERITLDVLVDKLPWGISIVKMPWSTEIIFVNW